MAKQIQQRRDTASNIAATTPAAGEMAWNTTRKRMHMGDGSTAGGIQHANYLDQQENTFQWATVGGTADAITLTCAPSIAGYGAGLGVKFKATANNTTAVTVNVNGKGTKNVYKRSGGTIGALAANDIVNGGVYEITYDGTQFQLTSTEAANSVLSVKQGDINTSQGTFSSGISKIIGPNEATGGTAVLMPGGTYGFMLESRVSATDANQFSGWICGRNSTSYGVYAMPISIRTSSTGSGSQTVEGRQRYITSSPPFDLGDGDAGGFVFAAVDSSGEILASYIADVPPWGYNGPTDIMCSRICSLTGKKYRKALVPRTFEELMDGAKMIYEEQEITQAIKNADMDLIPHPFEGLPPGATIVMIDPMDDRVRKMIEYQNAGGDSLAQLLGGYIQLDNEHMRSRKGPPGVLISRMKFKYSGKR